MSRFCFASMRAGQPFSDQKTKADVDTDAILNNVKRHIQLTPDEREFFLSLLEEKKLRKGEHLLKAGDVYNYENYIVSGCMRTYYKGRDKNDHVIYLALEDYWSGDLYSFWSGKPALYCVEALEDTTLLRIEKENLEALFDRVPKFERFFRIMLKNAVVSQQHRILQNLSFTAEERYREFREKYPRLELRIPQKHIASFLGVTPGFLSALRSKMAKR